VIKTNWIAIMNKIQQIKELSKIGKWFKTKNVGYVYVKGIAEEFGHIRMEGHLVEVKKMIGNGHSFAQIHINSGLREDWLIGSKEVLDASLIKKMDEALGILLNRITF
jgi:hypothetical protein